MCCTTFEVLRHRRKRKITATKDSHYMYIHNMQAKRTYKWFGSCLIKSQHLFDAALYTA